MPILTVRQNILLVLTVLLALTSCSATDQQRLIKAVTNNDLEAGVKDYVESKKKDYQSNPKLIVRDIKAVQTLLAELTEHIRSVWGEQDVELPSNKRFVKYTNQYKARAIVDFEQGWLRVETIDKSSPETMLQQAIVTTLLATSNPQDTDIFSDQTPKSTGQPFLYQQILDQDQKPIAFEWRANRFANHLIANQLERQRIGGNLAHFVQVPLVFDHQHLRQQQYSEFVLASARRYQVSPALIYGVIEVESSFNPFAVSHANAYGLMQVVASTAGRDVYQKVKHKSGQPSKEVLFDPKSNIDIGTAYLSILDNRYLANINHPKSRHYSVISAYNGGAGNVLKTFSSDRKQAANKINALSPAQVYNKLTKVHPKAESRRYLYKVNKAEKKYQ